MDKKDTKVQGTLCRTCDTSYHRPPSEKGQYCSTACYAASLRKRKEKACLSCGELFYPIKDNRKYCSKKCHGQAILGENHPRWNPLSDENTHIRSSQKYEEWARLIKERDDFTCQICDEKGGRLRSNHIKRFIDEPSLRFELTNGVTICTNCDYRWVFNREQDWESYFNFNLMTRGYLHG